MRRAGARFVLVALLVSLSAASAAAERALRVVTTTTDLKALVQAVGGDRVVVEALAPPMADPHAFDLKPAQLARLKQADLVFRVGLDHEPWLRRAFKGATVDASKGLPLLQTQTPRLRADARPHVHGLGNPHYWLDPENARPITATIVDALSRARPADAAAFQAGRARFLEALDAGLARWRAAMAPWRGTKAVVVHETWTYFAARFGIEIVAAAEPVPGVPPTPSELAALIERMRAADVRVFIIDPHSDDRLVRRIAYGAAARVVSLAPSVGAEPEARDYIALFDFNVRRFVEAMEAR